MVVEKCGDYKGNLAFYGQPVYNANRYAKLVKKRERLQNWLDYYQLKFERHPEKRPIRRVIFPTFLLLFLSFAHVPSSSTILIQYFVCKKSLSMLIFLCFRQDALVSVAGKWIKSTTTGLESASLRGR